MCSLASVRLEEKGMKIMYLWVMHWIIFMLYCSNLWQNICVHVCKSIVNLYWFYYIIISPNTVILLNAVLKCRLFFCWLKALPLMQYTSVDLHACRRVFWWHIMAFCGAYYVVHVYLFIIGMMSSAVSELEIRYACVSSVIGSTSDLLNG